MGRGGLWLCQENIVMIINASSLVISRKYCVKLIIVNTITNTGNKNVNFGSWQC